jgi:putative phosphoesterase
MKIVIASDLHANLEALAVLPRDRDQLWILGDLVNYGPNPVEVVDFVRRNASLVVRGNHDHAIGFREDPGCHGRFRELAEATAEYTQEQLRAEDREYLRSLPLQIEVDVEGTRFHLCHAVPSDPLFGYVPPQAEERWMQECSHLSSHVLLVGHTHLAFVEQFGNCLVVNPGSLGLPDNRSALASYVVWENGRTSSCWTAYRFDITTRKTESMPVTEDVRADLATLLSGGELPARELKQMRGEFQKA